MNRFATRAQPVAVRKRLNSVGAFTLVEVVLAIGLATGLLLAVLTFYNQAADMRNRVLQESERVATMRLVLDRLAGDLRAAQPLAAAGNEFTGDMNSMSFVKQVCTSGSPDVLLGASAISDLQRVTLTTLFATNETRLTVGGLDRNEAPLTLPTATLSFGTNSDVLPSPPLEPSNMITPEVLADIVRYVRFRYWDGATWQLSWTNAAPPPGVEIVLSTVANAEDAEPDSYPPDAFRRVIFVPGGLRPGGLNMGAPVNAAVP